MWRAGRRNGFLSEVRTVRCAFGGRHAELPRAADRDEPRGDGTPLDGRQDTRERGPVDAAANAAGGIATQADRSRRSLWDNICRHRGAAVSSFGGMAGGTGTRRGRGRCLEIHARGRLEDTRGAGFATPAGSIIGRAAFVVNRGTGRVHANVPAERRARSTARGAGARRVYPAVSGLSASTGCTRARSSTGAAGPRGDKDHADSASGQLACGSEVHGTGSRSGSGRVHPHVPGCGSFPATGRRSPSRRAGARGRSRWGIHACVPEASQSFPATTFRRVARGSPVCGTAASSRNTQGGAATWGVHAHVSEGARGSNHRTSGSGGAAEGERTKRVYARVQCATPQRARSGRLAGSTSNARGAGRIHAHVSIASSAGRATTGAAAAIGWRRVHAYVQCGTVEFHSNSAVSLARGLSARAAAACNSSAGAKGGRVYADVRTTWRRRSPPAHLRAAAIAGTPRLRRRGLSSHGRFSHAGGCASTGRSPAGTQRIHANDARAVRGAASSAGCGRGAGSADANVRAAGANATSAGACAASEDAAPADANAESQYGADASAQDAFAGSGESSGTEHPADCDLLLTGVSCGRPADGVAVEEVVLTPAAGRPVPDIGFREETHAREKPPALRVLTRLRDANENHSLTVAGSVLVASLQLYL